MLPKLSRTHYFIFSCLFLGILGSIIQREFWSAKALAETCLIIFSLAYLSSKYYASKTIRRYQDYYYQPNKARRFFDGVIVESGFHIVMPLSLSLLYASCFLLVLKYLPSQSYKTIGNLINPIIDFNKHYLKYPVTLLITILAILTLTRYLSVTKYKSFRKASKYITAPFKVVVILSFFLVLDKGIINNLLEYQFNAKPVVAEFVTFNATERADIKKDEEIEKALDEYYQYVLERLDNNYQTEENKEVEQERIFPDAIKLKSFVQEFPQIKGEVLENVQFDPVYNIGNNQKTFATYHESVWNYKGKEYNSSNLYQEARKKEASFFSDFFGLLADERKSIKKKVLSEDAEIIHQLMGDVFEELIPFEKISNVIPLHKIIKDKALDLLNEKLVNGIYALFSKKTVSKEDITKLNAYIDNILAKDFKASVKSVKNKLNVLSAYYAELNKSATEAYFNQLTRNSDRAIITYEDGLVRKKGFLQASRKKFLTDSEERNKLFAEWQKRNPDGTRQEFETAVDASVNKYYDERVLEIDEALSQKHRLKDYEYIRDKFSAGGIFFGKPISKYNSNEDPCRQIFYPQIKDCPHSILQDSMLTLKVEKNSLILRTNKGTFKSESPVATNLLLAAYIYVYASNTYPVLIDGFFDDNEHEIFAYNKNITYDKAMINMLFAADNFIFDVLRDSIPDEDLKDKFHQATTWYNQSRGEIALSRIYDDIHFITTTNDSRFNVNTNLTFSVVSKNEPGQNNDKKYREMTIISMTFNSNYTWLLDKYPYLGNLAKFASYQALFRSIDQKRVDISDLILAGK